MSRVKVETNFIRKIVKQTLLTTYLMILALLVYIAFDYEFALFILIEVILSLNLSFQLIKNTYERMNYIRVHNETIKKFVNPTTIGDSFLPDPNIPDEEFKIVKENKINELISVAIVEEWSITSSNPLDLCYPVEKKIRVLINKIPFLQCSLAVMSIELDKAKNIEIGSIDEYFLKEGYSPKDVENMLEAPIDLELELFVHTSNIQAFVEHDYNMDVMMDSFAIPFLLKLIHMGEEKAKYSLYLQLQERWKNGTVLNKCHLMEQFFPYIIMLCINEIISADEFGKIYKNINKYDYQLMRSVYYDFDTVFSILGKVRKDFGDNFFERDLGLIHEEHGIKLIDIMNKIGETIIKRELKREKLRKNVIKKL